MNDEQSVHTNKKQAKTVHFRNEDIEDCFFIPYTMNMSLTKKFFSLSARFQQVAMNENFLLLCLRQIFMMSKKCHKHKSFLTFVMNE